MLLAQADADDLRKRLQQHRSEVPASDGLSGACLRRRDTIAWYKLRDSRNGRTSAAGDALPHATGLAPLLLVEEPRAAEFKPSENPHNRV